MTAIPPNVKTGEPIKAAHINAIARAVRNLLRIRGGKGVTVASDHGGIRISLTREPEYVLPAIVTAVNSPNGENTAQDLTQVTYDVKIKGRPEFRELTGKAPDLRNVSTSVDGEPAKVGDECLVYLRKRGQSQEMRLHILTEKTVFFECEPPAQAATVTALMAEVARLSARLAAVEGQSPVASGQIGGPET